MRCPSVSIPRCSSTSANSRRVNGPVLTADGDQVGRRRHVGASSSSSRSRRAFRRSRIGPVSARSQRRSPLAAKCHVGRSTCVRRSRAGVESRVDRRTLDATHRCPTDQRAYRCSCACTATRRPTAASGVQGGDAHTPRPTMRARAIASSESIAMRRSVQAPPDVSAPLDRIYDDRAAPKRGRAGQAGQRVTPRSRRDWISASE